MSTYVMTEAEEALANIIWANEPVKSSRLVDICSEKLNWKKSTTYTVLKKICENNLFQNTQSIVTSIIGCEEYKRLIGENYLNKNYNGSLPCFVAAFAQSGNLTKADFDELSKLIEQYKED